MNGAFKRCTKCRRLKAVREFPKDAGQKSKLSVYCRQCHQKLHQVYYLKRKAAILKQQKNYNAAHGETKRNWRRRNRKKLYAYAERYRAKHRVKLRAYYRIYRAGQRERIRRKLSQTPLKAKPSPTRSKPLQSNPRAFPTAVPMAFEQDPRFAPGLTTPLPAIRLRPRAA